VAKSLFVHGRCSFFVISITSAFTRFITSSISKPLVPRCFSNAAANGLFFSPRPSAATSPGAVAYTGKSVDRIGSVDDLLVGRANIIHERGEHDISSGRYV
jgi:hypothetical protein